MTGPTAVGKTHLAITLARHLGGEIVGADAFQIYKGLPILTSQPDTADLAAVPHHLIASLPLDAVWDAAKWLAAAQEAISGIHARGRIAILTGGTGLYLKAFLFGLAEIPKPDPSLRAEVSALSLADSLDRLSILDPAAPAAIDTKNPVRVRRALEIVLTTGRPLRESRGQWSRTARTVPGVILLRERAELNARIETTVGRMLSRGAVDEVRAASQASPTAQKAIGFREIRAHLEGRLTLSEVREAMVRGTRQYAKRQLTWFRHQLNFPTIDLTATNDPLAAVTGQLQLA